MNKIYKVVWSKVKHCYVVTSELAKRQTKGCGARSLRMATVSLGVAASLLCSGAVLPVFGESVAEAAVTVSDASDPVNNVTPAGAIGYYDYGSTLLGFNVYTIQAAATTDKELSITGSSNNSVSAKNGFVGCFDTLNNVTGSGASLSNGTVGALIGAGTVTANAEGSAVKVTGGTVDVGMYGGFSYSGAATGNSIEISGDNTVINSNAVNGNYDYSKVVGGSGKTGASKNTVTIKGGTIDSEVSGGYVQAGVAGGSTADKGNKVIINGGEVKNGVIGGYSDKGDATYNSASLKGGSVYGIVGGATKEGDATNNSVIIEAGDVKFYYGSVLGGYSDNGDAVDNTVTISGGTLVNTSGVQIKGGEVYDAAHKATGNKVNISNGTIGSNEGSQYKNGFYVIAGDASTRGGNATDNAITISGGSFAGENTFEFYGGKTKNIFTSHSETGEVITATVAANKNTVEISGGTFSDNENVKIYGAYSSASSSAIFGTDSKVTLTATVDENKVKISGGTFSGNVDVYGGYGTASAGVYGSGEEAVTTLTTNGNTVEISGGTFSGNVNVYGGYGHADGTSESGGGTATSSSSADNNKVIISGGKVAGNVYGGLVEGAATGGATSNKIDITGGTIGFNNKNTKAYIYGGLSVTAASSNEVSIKNNVKFISYTDVYGGKASGNAQEKKQGEAKSNNVTINYSASNPNNKLDSIYGGYAGDDSNAPGVVTGNTVTINGGDIYWAYGGAAKYGNVEGNTANFSGGTNKNSVYGGATQYGNANNNTVTVDGGTIEEGAYGGTVGNQSEDSYGDATNNTVTINDGTVKQQTIGGNSRNGVAKNNTLTIAGGLIATNGFLVAGGQSTTGSAEKNAVFINKGTIQGSVYGGRSTEKGSVTGNQVIIKGGEITGRTLSSGYRVSNVYGGYSSGGDVTENNVAIQGNAAIDSRSNIYGGWSMDYVWVNKDGVLTREERGGGAVSYNSVNIFKAITVNGLYGGVGDATKSTGNNLYIATTGVKAEEVGNFQTIALTSALSWSDGATVLTATKFDDGTAVKAKLDVSSANFSSAAKGEKMTLLASGTDNNIKALSLKYNGGTADLSESKLNQVVKEGTVTPDSGTNGVTINTSKNAHIVSLDAANSFKNVTYRVADYVQGVSFGEMTWGTGRDASGTDFTDVTDANIDTSGLTFKDPGKIAANGTMKLVENATNLATGTDREHSQSINQNATNGVTITGSLNGTVTRTTAGEIGYKATGTTLTVNLAGWDGNEDSTTLSGWAKPASATVETDSMNVSGMNPGDKKTILTADTADFFKDAVVNGTNKWKDSGDFSETTKGVTVTGTTTGGGVKVDETTNKSIIYQQSKNDVKTLKLEGITFDSTDVAATFGNAYDFTPATITASDTIDVLFTNASSLTSNQSMTLVDTTGALGTATIAAFTDKSYVKPINEDVTGNLHLNGGRTDWLKQDGGTKLVYTVGDNLVTDATLSGDLAWDVSAPHYNNTDYKFDGNTTVNVGVNFTATVDPLNATTKSMTLIKNAADDSKVTGTPAFTVSLDQANTTLSANATGAAGLSGNDVTYTVSGVELNKVTVKSVGDTYDTVPDGWTMASNLTIDTDSMTEPIFAAGSPKAILKGNGYFNSVTITGANAFGTKDFEPVSGNGVTLSGTQDKGVDKSPDNAYIVYKMGKKNVQTVDIGTVAWGGEALDGSSADYNYAGAAFGTDNFVISNPDQVEVNTAMTLLKANETLAKMAEETKKTSYAYSPVSGVRIDGDITGTMSRSGNNIMFAATENKASQLTFTNVEWKDTLMTRPANIVFDGAKVVTTDIKFTNIDSQVADQTMTLVKNFDGTPSAIEGDHYMVGSGRMGEGAAEMSGNDLIFRAKTGTAPTEATHETVMAMEAGTAVVAAGREYVDSAVEGLGLVSNMAPDGTSTFASMGGGVGRYKTGSHVDTHTWSAVVAVGSKREHKKGNLEWGVFAEYGRGNYTLHDDNGGRGDGDTNYAGGGLLAKWTNKHDVYTEASVRMGRMSDSASNMLMDRLGNSYGYDIHANYFGAHVGLGKIIKVKKNRDLDVYGKYFYLRRNGVDFDAGGNHYTLDSVTSSLLRIGARYGSNDKKWNWYGGLAYEYEFGGESKGTVDGLAIRSASIKGGSVRGEIGMRMEATKTNPWKVDIGIYGYGGKHRGFGGNVSVAYMF